MKVKKAVIPAAGFGTRMLPASKAIPKEMLSLVDKPLIHYIVKEAVDAGIEDILIIISRGKSEIEDYFDRAPELEKQLSKPGKEKYLEMCREISSMANITYVRQPELLGLGHAVSFAKKFVGNEPFAVLLGDDIMDSTVPVTRQLIEAAEKYECSAVGVKAVDLKDIGKYCSLKVSPVEDKIFTMHDIVEKPRPEQVFSPYAILGRYVFTPKIMEMLETQTAGFGGEIQLTDSIKRLGEVEKVLAVDFEGKRYDAGNLKGYLEATVELALKHDEVGGWMKEFIKNTAQKI